jgi:hypothetical protein
MGQKGGEHQVQLEGSSSRATVPWRRAGVLCSASDVREARETRPLWVGGGLERNHSSGPSKQLSADAQVRSSTRSKLEVAHCTPVVADALYSDQTACTRALTLGKTAWKLPRIAQRGA